MIRDVVLPQLAMGMSEGTIVGWLVTEGGQVERDAPLVSVETEKVVTDIPAPYHGYVHIVTDVNQTVPVETLIAQIASSQDEYTQLLEPSAHDAATLPAVDDEIRKPDPPAPGGSMIRVRASALAKKIAGLEGIPLSAISGTGPEGRIVQRDVLSAVEQRKSNTSSESISSAKDPTLGMKEKCRIPLTGMRGAIAKHMMQAKTTTAQNYIYFEIDITKLLSVRETMLDREEELGIRVSMISIYMKALAFACQHVPMCNATLVGDEITIWENVNVGMAVAVRGKGEYDSGLLVPVVRNVDVKSVLQISWEIKDLVSRAHAGDLNGPDMKNHTITLSSTAGLTSPGSWTISSPVLNLPAVLAFQPGTPIKRPVVIDNQIVVRDILPCGLTYDHRALDGEPVGRFIRKITDLLSNPELMLL